MGGPAPFLGGICLEFFNIQILGFIAAILGTCSLIPQVIKILRSHSTSGISLMMYLIIAIDSLVSSSEVSLAELTRVFMS